MSDNLDINPSEFYYAIKDVGLSIEEIENAKKTLMSLKDLGINVSTYELRINNILNNLEKLDTKLLKVKTMYIKSDKGIASLFDYLDKEEDEDEEGFNDINLDDTNTNLNKEQQLNNLKGNNKDLGGKITNNGTSILRGRL